MGVHGLHFDKLATIDTYASNPMLIDIATTCNQVIMSIKHIHMLGLGLGLEHIITQPRMRKKLAWAYLLITWRFTREIFTRVCAQLCAQLC
jgi:hypothetical protein